MSPLAAPGPRRQTSAGWLLGGALVLAFYLWTVSSSGDPFGFGKDQGDYYNLLTDGFLQGQLSLPVEPPPELLALPDPYDPEANEPYRLHDASLYDGRYYLYFGPTPAVLAFLPWRVLPGDLPEELAVAIFALIGTAFAVALLRYLTRRYLPETPGWMLGAGAVALVAASAVPFTLRRVEVYEVAIICAYALAFAGLWCLATGVLGERLRPRRLAAASLLLGLAVAARPTMLVVAALLVVACVAIWQRDTEIPRERLVALLLGPILACGIALAIYNQLRFESPFDFGQGYQLASTDMQDEGGDDDSFPLSAENVAPALWHYLLARPHFTLGFPFIHVPGPVDYPGTLSESFEQNEPTGGLLTAAPILILIAGAWWLLRRPEDRGLRRVVLLLSLTGLGTLLLISVVVLGTSMRYEVDFASLLLIPALLVWFALARHAGRWVRAVGLAAITWAAVVGIAISFEGETDGLRTGEPETYEFLEDVTSPLPTAIAALGGTTTVTSVTPEPVDDTDPGPGYGRWGLVPSTGASLTIIAHESQRVALEAEVSGRGTLTALSREAGRRTRVPVRGDRRRLQLPVERGINHVDLRTSGDVFALRDATLVEQPGS